MRPAPLPALLCLFLAASAAACPFGPPGHVHFSPAQAAGVAFTPPAGRCAGNAPAPPKPAVPRGGPAWSLKTSPIPAEQRPYYEMIGYRIDDAAGVLRDADGVVVSSAAMMAEMRPFDASYERLDPNLWQSFMMSGHRLDERTCRLFDKDGAPVNALTMRVWRAMNRKSLGAMAVENLLAKLRYQSANAPVPEEIRKSMLALEASGTELPASIRALIRRPGITVGQLRAPAQASYDELTKYFDGQRTFGDFAAAAVPGNGTGALSRRKPVADPAERALGQLLSDALRAQLAKTPVGRERLADFQKGGLPPVVVVKLTQRPDDPNQPGAVYDYTADRMVINHWEVARILKWKLPPEKFARIEGRVADPGKLAALFKEDPSLLGVVAGEFDVGYFHELTHAAQSRRGRIDDELMRGNLPSANPLSKEHEAYREQCRYLFSKGGAAAASNGWIGQCFAMLKDPDAFKDGITRSYLSTFAGSAPLSDVAARQNERRIASRRLETGGGVVNYLEQKLKQYGMGIGDETLEAYRKDAGVRERAFLMGMPALRREAGGELIRHYRSAGEPYNALTVATGLPPGTFRDEKPLIDGLVADSVRWVETDKSPANLDNRLAAVSVIAARWKKEKKPWPPALVAAYQRDAGVKAEQFLAEAVRKKTGPRRPGGPVVETFEILERGKRHELLDAAAGWAKTSGPRAQALEARIQAARRADR